jgi:hypothetical protein
MRTEILVQISCPRYCAGLVFSGEPPHKCIRWAPILKRCRGMTLAEVRRHHERLGRAVVVLARAAGAAEALLGFRAIASVASKR